MKGALIVLLRSPLRQGEPPYTLGNLDQGLYEEGVHKGEKKPRKDAVWPEALPDGRLKWEILDTEINRGIVASMTAPSPKPNPAFAYTAIYPEDELDEEETHEVPTETPDASLANPTPKAGKKLVKGKKKKAKPVKKEKEKEAETPPAEDEGLPPGDE